MAIQVVDLRSGTERSYLGERPFPGHLKTTRERIEASKRCGKGWVYCVAPMAGRDLVKIGYTCSVKRRISSLNSSSPISLQLVGLTEGDVALENWLHWVFREDRYRDEWFFVSPELIALIQESMWLPDERELRTLVVPSTRAINRTQHEGQRVVRKRQGG